MAPAVVRLLHIRPLLAGSKDHACLQHHHIYIQAALPDKSIEGCTPDAERSANQQRHHGVGIKTAVAGNA